MKKVLILFGRSNWEKSVPFSNKEYQYSYEYFYSLCKEQGIQMYRASYEWYNYDKHIFSHAWIFEGKGGKWKKVSQITPDLIYDKTKARMELYYKKELIQNHYPFINDLHFTRIVNDKLITSLIFSLWSKKSWIANNKGELSKILPYIPSEKVVLKSILGSGGEDVQVRDKNTIASIDLFNTPTLAQEFIDSSSGIPGICNGMHDLRLVCVNEKIIYAYIREPKKGSYLANLAQGGTLTIVPKNKLPITLFPIMNYINEIFTTWNPRVYSIDFMFDQHHHPWIVELNGMPGLYFTPKEKPYMIEMYQELLEMFKKKLEMSHA